MGTLQDENLNIVKTMAANGILGKWDLVKKYVSDDMVMHVPPGLPYGRDYRGWDGYLQCFKEIGAFFAGIKASEAEYATFGNKVIVMSTMSGKVAKTGKPVSFAMTSIWELKDGMVVDIVPFYYDTKTICDAAIP